MEMRARLNSKHWRIMVRLIKGLQILFQTAFPLFSLFYALLWAWGMEGAISMSMGNSLWNFGEASLLRGFTLYLMLLFLTLVDELKDYEYDQKYNPDRVLVVGVLSHTELTIIALVLALGVIGINALFSIQATLFLIIDFCYAWLLLGMERKSKRLRDGVVINLVFTYPVQAFLSLYLIFSVQAQIGGNLSISVWLWPIAIMLAYLHFEFARKTTWLRVDDHKKFYSTVLGAKRSGFVTLYLGIAAILVAIWAFREG